MFLIPCQCCGQMLLPNWGWYICHICGFRICPHCLNIHKGKYGQGFKCSRCHFGYLKRQQNA